MAGLIDARILQPELAGSFAAGYRGAEQARQQTQQNQQQFEMNQMKMRQLQEDRAALTDLQSKLRAAGQSDDPNMFFRALIQTGNPDYMSKGYEGLQRYKDLVAYEREFGGGAPANAMAAPAASMVAPAATAAAPAPEGELVAAPIRPIPLPVTARAAADAPAPAGETNLQYLQRQFGTPGGAAGPNALAPAAAPGTNAMAAAAPDVNALMRRYNLASRAGLPDAAVILKQIEAALKADKMSLSDRFVPVGNLVFDRQEKQYITPTEAQLAMTRSQQTPAPIRLRPGESLVSREGETITSLPPAPPRAGAAASAAPSAKPPTAAQVAKDRRMEEARQALSKDIETQLGYYKKLADIGAMTSPTRSGAENVLAFARSSGPGQQLERAVGTDAQTLRDNIKNTRQRLFMQIKDATGATAGQMNSNVEMQAWLNSMTDPQQSIETVRETLKQMDSVIAGVRRQVEQDRAAKEPQALPAATAPAPTPGRRDLGGGFKLVD